MAKTEITFARTEYDEANCWTAIKSVIVEVPDSLKEKYDTFEWHVIGGAWVEENDEHPKTTDD